MSVPADDLFRQAMAAFQGRRLADAERDFRKILRREPRHFPTLNVLAIVMAELGRLDEAEGFIKTAAAINPRADETLNNYGLILKALKRPADAEARFAEAIALNPGKALFWNNRGTALNDLGRFDEAMADFDKATALERNFPDPLCNKGNALSRLARHADALAAYEKALALAPAMAAANVGRGNALYALERRDEALAAYDKALALAPNSAEAWFGRGRALFDLQRNEEALACCGKALAIDPTLPAAWLGSGNALFKLNRYAEALAAYQRALALAPDLAAAQLGCGNVLAEQRRLDEAVAAFDRALALKPDLAEAWVGLGHVYFLQQDYEKVVAIFDRALALKPGAPLAAGSRLFAKLCLCDWDNFEAERTRHVEALRRGDAVSYPFMTLALSSAASDQLKSAQDYAAYHRFAAPRWKDDRYAHERIRVAYFSADFRDHPVANLVTGVFEHHDKARFETIGISFGPPDDSGLTERIKGSLDRFIDVRTKTDAEIAELMHGMKIDLAVDLMGFTQNSRTNVLAMRPAPVQVNYLGYPGTMGADFIDYIVGDGVLTPPDHEAFYSEKIVRMPATYQPNNYRWAVSDEAPRRSAYGLPDSGVVFCVFNGAYKIEPTVFGSWMRLLKAVDGSVLWLARAIPRAAENLRKEAAARGVAPERLVFATRTPTLEEHLARQRLADVFLDTFTYNAHTTASDALWMGLPVVTMLGEGFASRVAASLLGAAGLGELVTHSVEEYERLALRLAREPQLLAAIKQRLAANRQTCALFDTAAYTRHLESAYVTMVKRSRSGAPPASFDVEPIAQSANAAAGR